jgi:hypothetical protein
MVVIQMSLHIAAIRIDQIEAKFPPTPFVNTHPDSRATGRA